MRRKGKTRKEREGAGGGKKKGEGKNILSWKRSFILANLGCTCDDNPLHQAGDATTEPWSTPRDNEMMCCHVMAFTVCWQKCQFPKGLSGLSCQCRQEIVRLISEI
ncbi:hypothetical protein F7725_008180, partial [Dissostichus mawsoni]